MTLGYGYKTSNMDAGDVGPTVPIQPSSKRIVGIQPSQVMKLAWEILWKNKNWLKLWLILTSSLVVSGLVTALFIGIGVKIYTDHKINQAAERMGKLGEEMDKWQKKQEKGK